MMGGAQSVSWTCLSCGSGAQINELKAEVAKFATIRDTLAYSADVLRDVTAHQKCAAGRSLPANTVGNVAGGPTQSDVDLHSYVSCIYELAMSRPFDLVAAYSAAQSTAHFVTGKTAVPLRFVRNMSECSAAFGRLDLLPRCVSVLPAGTPA